MSVTKYALKNIYWLSEYMLWDIFEVFKGKTALQFIPMDITKIFNTSIWQIKI